MAIWRIACEARNVTWKQPRLFCESARAGVGHGPARERREGDDASPLAVAEVLGVEVRHCQNAGLNHGLAKDHGGIKQRCYALLGLAATASARRICQGLNEVRNYSRSRKGMTETVSLWRRRKFLTRVEELQSQFQE